MRAICMRALMSLVLFVCTAGAALADWNTSVMVKPDYLQRYKPHRSLAWDPVRAEFVAAYGGDQLYVARGVADQWTVEVVDDSRGAGEATSLVVTDDGTVHISYYVFEDGRLWYAKNDGTGWQREKVMDIDESGRYNSLAIGADGTAYIALSYKNELDEEYLRVIDNSDGFWDNFYTADSTDGCGPYNSIALDSDGRPAVAYYCYLDKASYELRYTSFDGVNFSHVTVDSDAGFGASLAFNDAGHPHIAYGKVTDLYLAVNDGGGWDKAAVDDTSRYVGMRNQIFLDGATIHILTEDTSSRELLLYTFTGTWNLQVLEHFPSGSQWEISGAFDDGGDLTVMYLDTYIYSGSLHVLFPAAKTWEDHELVSFQAAGEAPALAVDSTGWPHVAHISSYDAHYAGWDETGWSNIEIEQMLWFYTVGIAMNGDDQPAMVYENWSSELVWATQTATGWDADVVPAAPLAGDGGRIRYANDGSVRLLYNDDNHVLTYAYLSGGTSWSFEQVNPGGNAWMNFDFAVGSDDGIWAVYSDYMTHDMTIAYREPVGGTWSYSTFSSSGTVGGSNAVVLNAADRPYVIYTDSDTGTIHLKYEDGTKGWVDVTLANDVYGSHHIGLALDDAGKIHFSYMDNVKNELVYGAMDSGAGTPVFTTIDALPTNMGVDSDLALDAQGRPMIAYQVPQYGRLMLAIDMPLPELTSVNPAKGDAGQTIPDVQIEGSDLFAVSAAWLAFDAILIDCTDITNPDLDTIYCDLNLAGAEEGYYDLHVTAANGEAVLLGAFEVMSTVTDDDDDASDDDDSGDDDDSDDDAGDDDDDDDDGCCGC